MPDIDDRLDREARIAGGLSELFADARTSAEANGRVDWDRLADGTRKVVADETLDLWTAVVLFFLFDEGGGALPPSVVAAGQKWTRTLGTNVAGGLVRNLKAELSAGRPPADVFSGRRGEVIAATEVTRTVSNAETLARSERAKLRGDTPKPPEGRSIVSPLAVGDGLIPLWITELDGKVCAICRPLHRKRFEAWADSFPEGPPAHPNCRCFLEYVEP